VLPFGTRHRKPYERLLIARRLPDTTNVTTTDPPIPLPARHVFATQQCTLHSRKPPLDSKFFVDAHVRMDDSFIQALLAAYLPTEPKCLELFARALIPGWSAWGNEPLKFQHIAYFESTSVDTSAS
jgi:hypothetical protein